MQDASKPIWIKPRPADKLDDGADFSIFIATPVHSDVSIHYTQALLEFQKECYAKKVKVTFQLFKSSLVTQGRNLSVGGFMETGHSHLLFIDSDIDFQAKSIFTMVEKDKDVISIPYPMKTINWEKILENFQNGKIKNVIDLSTGGNTYPMRLDDSENVQIENGVIEVSHSPTGCMLIKRSVIEKMIDNSVYTMYIYLGKDPKIDKNKFRGWLKKHPFVRKAETASASDGGESYTILALHTLE